MFWHLIWQTSCVTCPSGGGYKTVLLIWKARSRRKPATLNASFRCTHKEHIVCVFSSVCYGDGNPSYPVCTIQQCRKQRALHIFQKVDEALQAPSSTVHLHSRALLPSLPLPKHAMANFLLIPHPSRYFLSSPAVCCFYNHIQAWFPPSLLTHPTEGDTQRDLQATGLNYWSRFGACGSGLPLCDHLKITVWFILISFCLAFIPLYI